MNIVKYDPFRDLRSLQDEMTRLFTDVMPASFNREEMTRGAWAPSVDIYEDKDRLILEAELPGMSREDFDISVENNVITLRGERKFEKEDKGLKHHRIERAYGSFMRSFSLPEDADSNKVTADYKDGMLQVHLPKSQKATPKAIEIKVA